MVLASLVEFDFSPAGWIHLYQGGFDVLRGPIGVLLYLAFVPGYWLVPRSRRVAYLIATSLLLGLATVGPAYALLIAALPAVGLAVVRHLSRGRAYWAGAGLLTAGYAWLMVWPQPGFLPPVHRLAHGLEITEPLHFYLHWAGLGYLYLRTMHVLIEVRRGRMQPPPSGEWYAYLIFAPTLRMGPLYRFGKFREQLDNEFQPHRDLPAAGLRIATGLVRLAILGVLVDKFPPEVLFNEPWKFSSPRYIAAVYLAPISFFLWMSGYMDLAVGVGRAMGFTVPENFNWPWRAVNVAEFWQRWHITLSEWLRDYVFTPLVRLGWHFFFAFTLTFLLCGLWHGPAWCYIIWGGAQGVALAVVRSWSQYWKRQARTHTPLFQTLQRWRLIESPLNTAASWLLLVHFEIITIMIGMDYDHAGRHTFARLWTMLTGT